MYLSWGDEGQKLSRNLDKFLHRWVYEHQTSQLTLEHANHFTRLLYSSMIKWLFRVEFFYDNWLLKYLLQMSALLSTSEEQSVLFISVIKRKWTLSSWMIVWPLFCVAELGWLWRHCWRTWGPLPWMWIHQPCYHTLRQVFWTPKGVT